MKTAGALPNGINPISGSIMRTLLSFCRRSRAVGPVFGFFALCSSAFAEANRLPVVGSASFQLKEDSGPFRGSLAPFASDPDGDELIFTITGAPSKAGMGFSLSPDGTFVYTPARNANGSDSFTFAVGDRSGEVTTGVATIEIEPENDAPTLKVLDLPLILEDGDDEVKFQASDVDGDDAFVFEVSTRPEHGTVSPEVSNTGVFRYKPNEDYDAGDRFEVTVKDLKGATSAPTKASILIIAVNDRPQVPTGALAIAVEPNRIVTGQLEASDVDNDALTFEIRGGKGQVALDAKTGKFTYTPPTDFVGVDSFGYVAKDQAMMESTMRTINVRVGFDGRGIVADTMESAVATADLVGTGSEIRVAPAVQGGLTGGASDQAVDIVNRRLYVLRQNQLEVYTVDPTTSPAKVLFLTSTKASGTKLALSPDGRTAYIGRVGAVESINLYQSYGPNSKEGGRIKEFEDRQVFGFTPARAVGAMAVHPAGDRLLVYIDMLDKDKKLDLTNILVRSDYHGRIDPMQLSESQFLPADYGYLTQLDISGSSALHGAPASPASFSEPLDLKAKLLAPEKIVAIGIRGIAFTPDGNCAFLPAVGAQRPRATAFGVMPTTDEGSGGIVVLNAKPKVDGDLDLGLLGFIPTTEKGDDSDALRRKVMAEGQKIVHPLVLSAREWQSAATEEFALAATNQFTVLPALSMLIFATNTRWMLEDSFIDYGNMTAYAELYPRDMVGASSVAINHAGDFGVVTMQDTNNLGLLELRPDKTLEGLINPRNFNFSIKRGTGKTINNYDAVLDSKSPHLPYNWAYPQDATFTSDDSRLYIGMAGGVPKSDRTNVFGTADALALASERDKPNSVFLGGDPLAGFDVHTGGFRSPRLASGLMTLDSDRDLLSDQLEAYNRWNSQRHLPTPTEKAALLVASADLNHISDPTVSAGMGETMRDVGYFLPAKGVGYRRVLFSAASAGVNFGSRGAVTTIEQIGLQWHEAYLAGLADRQTTAAITRPYFLIGLLGVPGSGSPQAADGDAVSYAERAGAEVDFPYLSKDSDQIHDFVPGNTTAKPTNGSAESVDGFDSVNTIALIRFLLARVQVKRIEMDPIVIEDFLPEDLRKDPRIVARGWRKESPASGLVAPRRDLDDHMMVSFGNTGVDIDVDSDNNGRVDRSSVEDAIEERSDVLGLFVPASWGDHDNDGIPDFADGYNLIPGNAVDGACAEFSRMVITFPDDFDLQHLSFRLTYSASDPTKVTVKDPEAHLFELPRDGTFRVWMKNGNVARDSRSLDQGGDYVASGVWYAATSVKAVSDGARSFTAYIESVDPEILAGKREFVLEVKSDSADESGILQNRDSVFVSTAVPPQLIADLNRDKRMEPQAADANSVRNPLVLRCNTNDDDHDGFEDGCDDVVNGASDAKDLVPLIVNIGPVLRELPNDGSVSCQLTQEDGAVSFVYTNLLASAALDFASYADTPTFGPNRDQKLSEASVSWTSWKGTALNDEFLKGIRENDQCVLLLEGRKESHNPLVLRIFWGTKEVYSTKFHLAWANIVKDTDGDGKIDLVWDTAITETKMALWNAAYESNHPAVPKEVKPGVLIDFYESHMATKRDFVAEDSRNFYFRIIDPGANQDPAQPETVYANWYTTDGSGKTDDRPADGKDRVALVETGGNTAVFVSKALAIVSDTRDAEFSVFRGDDLGTVSRGDVNHPFRRAKVNGVMNLSYRSTANSTAVLRAPVFDRDHAVVVPLIIVTYKDPINKAPYVSPAEILDLVASANRRWAPAGVMFVVEENHVREVPQGLLGPSGKGFWVYGGGANEQGNNWDVDEKALWADLKSTTSRSDAIFVVFAEIDPAAHTSAWAIDYHRFASGDFYGAGNRVAIVEGSGVARLDANRDIGIGDDTAFSWDGYTLAHELYHVMYNRGDYLDFAFQYYFTFNTYGSFASPLNGDPRYIKRIHPHTIEWAQKRPTIVGASPSSSTIGLYDFDTTTGNAFFRKPNETDWSK